MKHTRSAGKVILFGVICALCMALAGCSSSSSTPNPDDPASQNREYMSQLNQQMDSIQGSLNDFQDAVAKNDVVTMQADKTAVEKTIDSVKATSVTDRLSDVKDGYVSALDALDDALASYLSLYTDVQNGTVSSDDYAQRLKGVQDAYDSAVSQMQDADDAVVAVANE